MLSPSFLPFELIIAESIRSLCVIVKAGSSPMLKLGLRLLFTCSRTDPLFSWCCPSSPLSTSCTCLCPASRSLCGSCPWWSQPGIQMFTEVFSLFDHHYLVISSVCQVILETPQLTLQSLILLCQCQPLLQHKLLHQLTPMMKILH